jgi:hypothetical protein
VVGNDALDGVGALLAILGVELLPQLPVLAFSWSDGHGGVDMERD